MGSKRSSINPVRQLADELRQVETTGRGKDRDMYKSMVHKKTIKTPGQYWRIALKTPADQDEKVIETPDPKSSMSTASSSGVSEP